MTASEAPAAAEPTTKAPRPSPWMPLDETAAYTRHNITTIRMACLLYERTKGKEGLRSAQPSGPRGKRFVHVDDADAWMRRQTPARGSRRFQIA